MPWRASRACFFWVDEINMDTVLRVKIVTSFAKIKIGKNMKIFHKIKEEKPESRENILDFDK